MAEAPTPLNSRQVAALLRATGQALRSELAALPDEALGWHPAPGEWCLKEALGHLLEAERRGFNGRIREILAQPGAALEGWDLAAVARQRRDCQRPASELLHEFLALREDSVRLVRGLAPRDLQHGGEHAIGFVRVGELIQEWLHHDRNHFRQALANVQAYVWPHMGATQRFSQP
jgi:hypothetical protein